jgi:sodium-dependent dicarboxylate transporter 2/3/5
MAENYYDKPLKIDRRPLWQVLADRTRRYQVLAGLMLLLAFLLGLEPPAGLSISGYRALILFVGCTFLWVSGIIPLAVTSLLAMAAIPLMGILERRQTYALFANEAVFFILGAFILAAALTRTGLSSRIGRSLLVRFGRTPLRLALTVFLLSALLSFAMSEHAVAAMMFSVVATIVRSLELPVGGSRYGKLLFMSIGWGCVIGGIATFLGGARAPLAVGMLREARGLDFSFWEWTAAALPIVLPLMLAGFLFLCRIFPCDLASVEQGIRVLSRQRLETGRITLPEKIVAAIMVLTLGGWIFYGSRFGLANIAILSAVALFVFKVVDWKSIEEYVNWGVILMYGGAITLASALDQSGAARWVADLGLARLSGSPLLVLAVISLLSLVLTECISNAAVIAILMPIGMSLEQTMGIDPRVMTLAIALPSGLAFCLPMGTPANAIVFSSGFLRVRDMIVPGLIIQILAWLLFLGSAWLIWPLLGLRIQP